MNAEEGWARLLSAAAGTNQPSDSDVVLQEALELGLSVAPAGVGCSITVMSSDVFYTPVASGGLALALDEAQYSENRGPCVDAAREQLSYRLNHLALSEQYPAFAAAAAEHGVLSSLSVPLPNASVPSALNLYAAADSAFNERRPQAVANLLARCIGSLRGTAKLEQPSPADLVSARRDNDQVVRAQRWLVEREKLNPAQAYGRLVSAARAENEPIAHTAHRLLAEAGQL